MEQAKGFERAKSAVVALNLNGKRNVLGVFVNVIDYQTTVESVIHAARNKQPYAVTALAVHGLMTGVLDAEQRYRLNSLNLVVPDGQPVRWALNKLFNAGLYDRVYGPRLTLAVCERAEKDRLPVFFYGGTQEILSGLQRKLLERFPQLLIAGTQASKFRSLSAIEKTGLVNEIRESGAAIVFVGLGCPRQEVWAYEYRERVNAPLLAVGAAFPFVAGTLRQAPAWMQERGLEWLYRLLIEPRRLWKRYLFLNPLFVFLLLLQRLKIARFEDPGRCPTKELSCG